MNTYEDKYLKYKKKYIQLKNKMKGGSDKEIPVYVLLKRLEEAQARERKARKY